MSETTFEKQVLNRLDNVEKTMSHIMEYIEDSKLTAEEKELLGEALEEHKKGKLLNSKEVFG